MSGGPNQEASLESPHGRVRIEPILFRSRDGSILDRLNRLYNSSRYPNLSVESDDSIATRPVSVWLTNDGLRSVEAALLFSEVVEILQELAVWADAASDPATMRDKVEARRRSGDATE